MKKNILLFLLLLLLGGIAYTLVNKKEKKATMDDGAYKFAIENIDDVHKIFIADRKGSKVTLTKGAGSWLLDGKHRVNEGIIQSTLDAMKYLDISSIPPRAAYENVMKEIATKGIKVEAYDKSGSLMKAYYFGGTSSDGYQTQIIMDGYDQPYYVQIKGAIGEVVPRFLKRYDDWRDPFIFRGISSEIDTFSVYYPRRRSQSFVIAKSGSNFKVSPAFETTAQINKKPQTNLIKKYFYDMEKIAVEAYFNNHSKIDSLKSQTPVVSVYLKKTNGDIKKWDFIEHGTRNSASAHNPVLNDLLTSKYILVDENKEALLGQEHLMKRIFWGYTSFYN